MSVSTLLAYLCGLRTAILKVAASKQAIWIGLLLVLSAGLAREYDGEDLLHEPWHLLLPLAASLVSSLVLYLVVYGVAWRRRCRLDFLRVYRSFLGLYWMTAPLAWLYAIPVERFLSPGDATAANLWLLAIVSAWRVALMTRVISVLFQARWLAAFSLVMFFADSVLLILLNLTPLPVVAVMGGIRLTESESVLDTTACVVCVLGALTWPVWAIAAMGTLGWREPVWRFGVADPHSDEPASRSVWIAAILSVIVWIFVLPVTQPEQQLRRHVERQLKQGRPVDALATMSAHPRGDFPPHWDPPPRLGYGESKPPLLDVIEALVASSPTPWVRELWLEKFQREVDRVGPWHKPSIADLERYLALLERLPEVRARMPQGGQNLRNLALNEDLHEEYPEPLRERILRVVPRKAHLPEATRD